MLSRSGPLLRVSPQRRSYASVEEAQDEPHEVAPEEEDEGKPTVCIIGAGIAGCSVGHVLKYVTLVVVATSSAHYPGGRNKGVPCEIFEKHLQDSIIKTKRQYVVSGCGRNVRPLKA